MELGKAVSWLSFSNIATRSLALLTLPFLTRWLSPTAFGEAALVTTTVALVTVFALTGTDMSYSRHYFSNTIAPGNVVEVYCWQLVIGLSVLLAAATGILWWTTLAEWLGAGQGVLVFVVLGIAVGPISVMAQARARLQGRYSVIAKVLSATAVVSATIALSAAYFWRQDSWPILLSMSVTIVLPLLLLGMPGIASLARSSGLSNKDKWNVTKVGLAALVTAPAYWILCYSDRWFLARLDGAEVVGIYTVGFAIATIGTVINSAIISAWLPELSRLEGEQEVADPVARGKLAQMLLAVMLIAWLAVLSAGGDVIRLFAAPVFWPSIEFLPWLATGVLFYGAMHVGNACLVLAGKLHWSAVAWLVGATVCLTLNAIMIPKFGPMGAATTQAISFLIVMILVWLAVVRFSPITISTIRLGLVFVIFILAAGVMHSNWHASALLSLALKLPLGLILAFTGLQILAPNAWQGLISGKG